MPFLKSYLVHIILNEFFKVKSDKCYSYWHFLYFDSYWHCIWRQLLAPLLLLLTREVGYLQSLAYCFQ